MPHHASSTPLTANLLITLAGFVVSCRWHHSPHGRQARRWWPEAAVDDDLADEEVDEDLIHDGTDDAATQLRTTAHSSTAHAHVRVLHLARAVVAPFARAIEVV